MKLFLQSLFITSLIFVLSGCWVSDKPLISRNDPNVLGDLPKNLAVLAQGKTYILSPKINPFGKPIKGAYQTERFDEIIFASWQKPATGGRSEGQIGVIVQAREKDSQRYFYTFPLSETRLPENIEPSDLNNTLSNFESLKLNVYTHEPRDGDNDRHLFQFDQEGELKNLSDYLKNYGELAMFGHRLTSRGGPNSIVEALEVLNLDTDKGAQRYAQISENSGSCTTNACLDMSPEQRFENDIKNAAINRILDNCNRPFFAGNASSSSEATSTLLALSFREQYGWCVADFGIAKIELKINAVSSISCDSTEAPMTCSFNYSLHCRFTTIANTSGGDDLLCDAIERARQPAIATFEDSPNGLRIIDMELAKP
jgi:hypothetical protein